MRKLSWEKMFGYKFYLVVIYVLFEGLYLKLALALIGMRLPVFSEMCLFILKLNYLSLFPLYLIFLIVERAGQASA